MYMATIKAAITPGRWVVIDDRRKQRRVASDLVLRKGDRVSIDGDKIIGLAADGLPVKE